MFILFISITFYYGIRLKNLSVLDKFRVSLKRDNVVFALTRLVYCFNLTAMS